MEQNNKTNKQKTGLLGENLAAEYLYKHHYQIVERNYKKPWGEIDIIAKYRKILVFFEVKTMSFHENSKNAIRPEDQITQHKKSCFKKIIASYLKEKNLEESEWQIDIIAIDINLDKNTTEIRHIENVILD